MIKSIQAVDWIFGFVLAPSYDPIWSADVPGQAPKFIALDNQKLVLVDLSQEDEQQIKPIANFATGVGGYMPRYLCRKLQEDGKFVIVILQMFVYSEFKLV